MARARDSNESKALSNITPRSTPDPIGETIWNYLSQALPSAIQPLRPAFSGITLALPSHPVTVINSSPWAISSAG